ncbi:MAG: hypothetical protein KA369_02565 [Spirochaetes bacterium]|nr:hypothetical protein [Spirochaetota bacterium]
MSIAEAEEDTIPYDRILRDSTLIVPGIGAEGILINEDIEDVFKRVGRMKYKVSKPRATGELFKNVFNVNSRKKIYFETLYYHEENKYTACVFHGKVVAVIGLNNNRVTLDSVNLRSGINSFIFNYGKRNLYLVKSDSNAVYIYPDRGTAVADDGMNDSIDFYIVFRGETSETR